MFKKLLQWDKEAFIYLNNLGSEQYDAFWIAITNINFWIPLYLLFGFLFFYKTPFREGLIKLITVVSLTLFIVLITHLTKDLVGRLRPNNNLEINTLIRVLKNPTDYSFFSGHAASSFSITFSVFLLLRKKYRLTVLFFIWPILFTASRIYVGVHFPMDIIAGAIVGILLAVLFYSLYNRFLSRNKYFNT